MGGRPIIFFMLYVCCLSNLWAITIYKRQQPETYLAIHSLLDVTPKDVDKDIDAILRYYYQRIEKDAQAYQEGKAQTSLFLPIHKNILGHILKRLYRDEVFSNKIEAGQKKLKLWDIIALVSENLGYFIYVEEALFSQLEKEVFYFDFLEDVDAENFFQYFSDLLKPYGVRLFSEGFFILLASDSLKIEDHKAYLWDVIRKGRDVVLSQKDKSSMTKVKDRVLQVSEKNRRIKDEKNQKDPMKQGGISLDFDHASIDSVLRFFATILNYTIVKEAGLEGEVSLYSPQPLSEDKAFAIFKKTLRAQNIDVEKDENLKLLVMRKRGKISQQSHAEVMAGNNGKGDDLQLVSQIVELQYGDADTVAQAIQSLVSSDGSVIVYRDANMLILNDVAKNVDRITKVICEMDQKKDIEKTKVYAVKHAEITHLHDTLLAISQQYSGEKKYFRIAIDQRTKNLFITGFTEGIAKAEELLAILDKQVPQFFCEVTVVRVPHFSMSVPLQYRLFSQLMGPDFMMEDKKKHHVMEWKLAHVADKKKMFHWGGLSRYLAQEDYMSILRSFAGADQIDVTHLPLQIIDNKDECVFDIDTQKLFQGGKDSFRIFFKARFEKEDNDGRSVISCSLHQKGESLGEGFLRMYVNSQQTVVLGGLLSDGVEDNVKVLIGQTEALAQEENEFYEYLVFITPTLLLNERDILAYMNKPENTFSDSHEECHVQTNPISLKNEKENLSLLFPEGFEEALLDKNQGRETGKLKIKDVEMKEDRAMPSMSQRVKNEDSFFDMALSEVQPEHREMRFSHAEKMIEEPQKIGEKIEHKIPECRVQQERAMRKDHDDKDGVDNGSQMMSQIGGDPDDVMRLEGFIFKENIYKKGLSLYEKEKYRAAIQEFASIVTVDPEFKDAKNYLRLSRKKFQAQIAKKREEELKKRQQLHQVRIPESMDQKFQGVDAKQSMTDVVRSEVMTSTNLKIPKKEKERLVATVVGVSDSHPLVILDIGMTQGVAEGMIFRVFRENSFVAKIVVEDIEPLVSSARILAQENEKFMFQVGDKAVLLMSEM